MAPFTGNAESLKRPDFNRICSDLGDAINGRMGAIFSSASISLLTEHIDIY
jgi:hypothetical protein